MSPTPHSHRRPPRSAGWPPPGWTRNGLLRHTREHARSQAFLAAIAGGQIALGEQQDALDVRKRELVQHGRTVADAARAVQDATTELLALPWLAEAVTRPMSSVREAG